MEEVKKQLPDVKFCKGCEEVKPTAEYYKTGYKEFIQKECKSCSNQSRKKYKFTKIEYIKKGRTKITGFKLLPPETRDKIKYDIYVKKNYKTIAKEYSLCYGTLMSWKKKNLIPLYDGEELVK
jgi:hypothetical protein